MKIQELEIEGFRSLRDVRWTPGRLNILIGPNGAGKSNLLQALELLHTAAMGKLAEQILSQGGIAPLLWDQQVHSISWTLKTGFSAEDSFLYALTLQQLGMTSSFRIERETLQDPQTWLLERDSNRTVFLDRFGTQMEVSHDLVPETQTALSRVAVPMLVTPAASQFHKSLLRWAVYQNFRVDREASLRQAPVTRYERLVDPDGQNLIPVLHTLYTGDREFKKSVDDAMRAAFGTDYEELVFPPAADQRVQLRLRWRTLKTEQSAANLSDGTLRFLLLTTILANPEPGDLIAIDEPETGLHPSMFPVIAELATEAAQRTQVIFTSHSPQFLDAFRDEAPTTTVTEWIDGETRLSVLDGKDLQKWLAHYSLGELFRSGELEAMA